MVPRHPTHALILGLVLLQVVGGVESRAQSTTLQQVGRTTHPPLEEISGLAKSASNENLWWVHNDSGDEPRIFAVDSTGAIRAHPLQRKQYAMDVGADSSEKPIWPGVGLGAAAHTDYEDIAATDSVLYVGDVGNNFSHRRDLGIYVVPEPTPLTQRTRPIKFIPIAYPDQTGYPGEIPHFDAEALFVSHGQLHLLTKRRSEDGGLTSGTTLYRLDTEHPHRINTLARVGETSNIPAPTAGALSPSGDRLAVLSYESVWIFPRPTDGTNWLSGEPRRLPLSRKRLKQAEAIDWDDPQTLRIMNEQRDVFVLSLNASGE